MAANKASDAGRRGSRNLWLGAAHATPVESGVDDVRIQQIGDRLRLSRTDFYWFFSDREASLVALWRDKNSGNLIDKAAIYADTVTEAVLDVFGRRPDDALFDASFECAVRSWALRSPRVGEETRKADDARHPVVGAQPRPGTRAA